jgi:hypothetical protein
MPRKKAAIHNGGGIIQSAAKAAKSFFNNIKNRRRRIVPVHPDIPRHSLPPTIVQEIQPPIIANSPSPTIVQEIQPLSIIEIANKWMLDPTIDPYTNNPIVISIHSKSKYVKLYIKIINELINYIIANKRTIDKQLTIDDCKYIKNNLTIIHSIIPINPEKYIKYDHLFIRYFINRTTNKYTYDIAYREDNEIKLYLDIYNSILLKPYHTPLSNISSSPKLPNSKSPKSPKLPNSPTIDDIFDYSTEYLLNNNIKLEKSDLSAGNLILDLCKDIRPILYMHESMITIENYKIALNNKKRLDYIVSLFDKFKVRDYEVSLKQIELNDKELKYIYDVVYNYFKEKKITKIKIILSKLIEINHIILKLYSSYFTKDIQVIQVEKGKEYKLIKEEDKIDDKDKFKDSVNLFPYCKKDEIDPYSLVDISNELDDKGRKYVVNIISYDGKKVYYHCFDTISVYDYILICINTKTPFINLYRPATSFTDDDLDEICDKIFYFTKKPIFRSHIDINEAIAKRNGHYSYKNYLELSVVRDDYERPKLERNKIIIGEYKIYLNLNFGGVILRVINEKIKTSEKAIPPLLLNVDNSLVQSIPIFEDPRIQELQKQFFEEEMNKIFEIKMNTKKNAFPYNEGRVGNNSNKIVDLEAFKFDTTTNIHISFIKYKNIFHKI